MRVVDLTHYRLTGERLDFRELVWPTRNGQSSGMSLVQVRDMLVEHQRHLDAILKDSFADTYFHPSDL